MDIVIIIWVFINFPTLISLPTLCYLLRDATSEIYGPRVYSSSYLLFDLLFATFIFRSIVPKTQKYLAALSFCIFYFAFYRDLFIQSIQLLSRQLDNFWCRYPKKGLTTPYTCRVASICSLCGGTVYIVLLGSPTGFIPWFYNWGKYLP